MKNLLLVVALLLAWPTVGLSQAGQVIPRVALFGGFTRVFDKADPNSFSVGSFHFDGGEASAEVSVSRCVGIVGGYGWQMSNRDGQVVAPASLFPIDAHSQSVPIVGKYTVFGGFTTVRNRFDYGSSGVPGFPAVPGPVFYLNGWEASIERKFAPWIGIVADVSQQLGTRSGGQLGPEQENQVFVLFGPQFSLRVAHWLIPFAHVLIGPSYGLADYLSQNTAGTVSSFATAIGGGVDVKIFGPVWLRAAQVDYLHTSNDFGEDHSTQVRISVGIAFRF